jgi:hypothetical protein
LKWLLTYSFIFLTVPAFADFKEIKSVINTQPSRKDAAVKSLAKAGLLHTGNQLNQRIKNLKVSIDRTAGKIKIEFDYPSLEWALGPSAYPFWINLADKNGNILEKFTTSEDLVPEGVYYRTQPGTVGRSYLDEKSGGQRKAFLMKPTGNVLRYDVNLRDVGSIEIAEVGFITTLKRRNQGQMDEFVPEKIFIKNWSSEKVYEK